MPWRISLRCTPTNATQPDLSVEYDQDGTGDQTAERENPHLLQADSAREAGIFPLLPLYHPADLPHGRLARPTTWPRNTSATQGMLGYVAGVQRKEIRQGIACVKHQNMSGSDIGDDHKDYFSGEAALKAAGKDNTMNQF